MLSIITNYKILKNAFLRIGKSCVAMFQKRWFEWMLIGFYLSCFGFIACQKSNRDPVPDVSNIAAELKWFRFETIAY